MEVENFRKMWQQLKPDISLCTDFENTNLCTNVVEFFNSHKKQFEELELKGHKLKYELSIYEFEDFDLLIYF